MADAALAPGSTIGILGGGQLGRMLACAAAEIGLKCRIFCDEPDAPSFDVAATHVCAPYDDIEAVQAFARGCDVVTFEFENVPLAAVEAVTALVPVYPPPRALEATQDRLVERRLLDALSIPVAPYREVGSEADLTPALEEIGRPAMLKSRRLGYDGKG
ncbi:MAG: ATP-grasp domain-containing protein, partial [Hyphomicrobiales bacterium]|nr:ATP-grasp domain-containing protein [Hyphomicrobiales bacterium]